MNPLRFFSSGYQESRQAFLAACRVANVDVRTYEHPECAPDGQALFTDVARIGSPLAKKMLVLTSGVHGPELMAGSACQTGWLLSGGPAVLPHDCSVLLVHAINPWGAAHLRRFTEGNIDLCRNWIDFDQPLPINPAYDPLHAAVLVDPDDHGVLDAAQATLDAYRREHGEPGLYGALMGGQYEYADGIGYGGRNPTWSRRTMEAILHEYADRADRICMVDYHTGVGPYGYGSIVTLQTGGALARTRQIFGEWVIAPNEPDGPENFVPVTGHTSPGYEHALKGAEVTAVVLEYGTYAADRMLALLLNDHRRTFSARGNCPNPLAARQGVLRFFYPEDIHWRQGMWNRSQQVVKQALTYLG